MFNRLWRWWHGLPQEQKECDHVFFPVMQGRRPLGQQCALCGKFHSAESLGIFWKE